jgi:hypothetical protein
MKFLPVPGTNVLMCIYETRVQDFRAFVTASQFDYKKGPITIYAGKEVPGLDWERQIPNVKEPVGDKHPVQHVSWEDAQAFNQWLTQQEKDTGGLPAGLSYRLPTESEWSRAFGPGPYGWGAEWPPPPMSGNFTNNVPVPLPENLIPVPSWDRFRDTSPVGSFNPNSLGIYDLDGNASEFGQELTMRSGVWMASALGSHFASSREPHHLNKNFKMSVSSSHRSICPGFRCVLDLSEASTSTKKKGPVGGAVSSATLTTPMSSIAALPTGPTTWTDTKGRTITATFKAIASGNVLLDIAGKVTPVPLNTLSAESQKLAREYQRKSEEEAGERPASAGQIPADAMTRGPSRYAYFPGSMSWLDARLKAEALGGRLASFETDAEEAAVAAQIRARHGQGIINFWIGGVMNSRTDTWHWTTGKAFSHTHWGAKEPNNATAKGRDRNEPPYVAACHLGQNGYIGWHDYSLSQSNWQNIMTGYLVEWDPAPAKTSAGAVPASSPNAVTVNAPAVQKATKDATFHEHPRHEVCPGAGNEGADVCP